VWLTEPPAFKVVCVAACDLAQPSVVQIWSVPDTIVQDLALGDSVSTQDAPVLRIVAFSRGSVPDAYRSASVLAVTVSARCSQAGGDGFGVEDAVGDVDGAAAEGLPPDPPEHDTAIAMTTTASIANRTARRIQ
jgi:hypothetical protein